MQLVGDDDDVVVRSRDRSGLPVLRGSPKIVRRSVGRGVDPDDGGTGGAGNRDRDVLGGDRALRIRHRHRIGECQRLSLRNEIREVFGKVGEFPVDRSAAGQRAVSRDHGREGFFECRHGRGRQRIQRRHIKRRRTGSGHRRVREHRGNRVGVGQVDIDKCQRSRGGHVSDGLQVAAGGEFASRIRDAFRPGGDDGNVVGAGDRDRERKGSRLRVRREIVVDHHNVGQRQGLAGGEEVESIVRDAVG